MYNMIMLPLENAVAHVATWAIGALIGIGQMLSHTEPYSWKRILGQALVSGGLGASSGAILLWIPNAPLIAVFGLSAAIASLGVTIVEKILVAVATKTTIKR